MRRAARTDANHEEIVLALREIGCSVLSLAGLGKGAPDLAVGRANRIFFLELKDGTKPPSARKLTPDEVRFRDSWRGHYAVVESIEDALRVVMA